MRIPISASASLILALGLALLPGRGSRGEQAKTEPAPASVAENPGSTPPASIPPELEEELTRTREDLENLQLWLNAKRAQLRAAETSSQLEHKLQGEWDRFLKKGMATPLRREVADVEFLEADSQRALILAEIGDLQVRYNRTKRYHTRLEQ